MGNSQLVILYYVRLLWLVIKKIELLHIKFKIHGYHLAIHLQLYHPSSSLPPHLYISEESESVHGVQHLSSSVVELISCRSLSGGNQPQTLMTHH